MVADSQPGHIDQIKQTNAGAVYRLIDQLGPVSRIDLSRLAQLAPARKPGTIYLFVLAVAKFSLHCAILAANWW